MKFLHHISLIVYLFGAIDAVNVNSTPSNAITDPVTSPTTNSPTQTSSTKKTGVFDRSNCIGDGKPICGNWDSLCCSGKSVQAEDAYDCWILFPIVKKKIRICGTEIKKKNNKAKTQDVDNDNDEQVNFTANPVFNPENNQENDKVSNSNTAINQSINSASNPYTNSASTTYINGNPNNSNTNVNSNSNSPPKQYFPNTFGQKTNPFNPNSNSQNN